MNAHALDTHKYFKRLVASGMPEAQAEAVVEGQRQISEEQVATKRDIVKLEGRFDALETRFEAFEAKQDARFEAFEAKQDARFVAFESKQEERFGAFTTEVLQNLDASKQESKKDISDLRGELKRDMSEMELRLEHKLTVRLGAMMIATAATVAAIVKLL